MRVAILGNAGAGKSTLARRIAGTRGLKLTELDALLWARGWVPRPEADYAAAQAAAIAGEAWVIEGLGRQDSIAARLARATEIILFDLPLALHLEMASGRQAGWRAGTLAHPPAGMATPPPTAALLATIAEVDRDWMPVIRTLSAEAASRGAVLHRLDTPAAI